MELERYHEDDPGDHQVMQLGDLGILPDKHHIDSAIRSDQFLEVVDQCWEIFTGINPHICERFSLAEFRHVSALQLYGRIQDVRSQKCQHHAEESVHIELPKDIRIFQPLWRVLDSIGVVDDDDLSVVYIPYGVFPSREQGGSDEDLGNIIAGTLYDWKSSWESVETERAVRARFVSSLKLEQVNTDVTIDSTTARSMLRRLRQNKTQAHELELFSADKVRLFADRIYRLPVLEGLDVSWEEATPDQLDNDIPIDCIDISTSIPSSNACEKIIQALLLIVRGGLGGVTLSQSTAPVTLGNVRWSGTYGRRLHWDTQLWLDYAEFVKMLSDSAKFCVGMPHDVTGTYMWLLPVETGGGAGWASARLPKASIAQMTWQLALIFQMSMLPYECRSTWYTETSRMANVRFERKQYILTGIKKLR